MKNLVFLSYAHDDVDMVRKIYKGLKERKVNVWFDEEDLGPGKWKPQIRKIIPKCKYFMFCVSNASLRKVEDGAGFVEEELQYAYDIAMDQDEKEFIIIPVRLEDCERGDPRMSSYQQYDLFPDMEKGLDKLAGHLGRLSLSDAKVKDKRTENEKLIYGLEGKAAIAYYSGDYEIALTINELIFKLDLENYIARYNKGISLAALGKHNEAIEAYNKALEIKPDYHKAWNHKGLSLAALEKHNEAIEAYNSALEIKPDKYEAWNNRGLSLAALGKHNEAIEAYDKALEIKSDLHESWYNRGISLAALGKHNEAIEAYDKALEIKPDKYEAWNDKGNALAALVLKKHNEAIEAYDKALEIKPDYHEAWNNKGVHFILQL